MVQKFQPLSETRKYFFELTQLKLGDLLRFSIFGFAYQKQKDIFCKLRFMEATELS